MWRRICDETTVIMVIFGNETPGSTVERCMNQTALFHDQAAVNSQLSFFIVFTVAIYAIHRYGSESSVHRPGTIKTCGGRNMLRSGLIPDSAYASIDTFTNPA